MTERRSRSSRRSRSTFLCVAIRLLATVDARADASANLGSSAQCASVIAPQLSLNPDLASPGVGAWSPDIDALKIFYSAPDLSQSSLGVSRRTPIAIAGARLWLLDTDTGSTNDWTFLLVREMARGICVVNAFAWNGDFGPQQYVDRIWTSPDGALALVLVHHDGRTRSSSEGVDRWTYWAVLATDGHKLWLAWDQDQLTERERLSWNRGGEETTDHRARLLVRSPAVELQLQAGGWRKRLRLGADGRFASMAR
jgi:hypothetical protein